ncbi:DUF4468 domain-containing protein [Sphingobacterium mizutaii]|uniref:DUF4468 domain-containing protein n=1 Tax=Sphingobacterium mizutaii TaxID=1010 RepID=UPI0035E41514
MDSFVVTSYILFSKGQDLPIVDDKIVYEKIVEAPDLSKSELYAACKKFVANAFKSAKKCNRNRR